ncbi:MAG TPA: hypothetical protein ENN40_09665 [Candidatus Aminicenantes bacterium]|nr:hypothetical protein [Candidatus Aminicenantes bacterium]
MALSVHEINRSMNNPKRFFCGLLMAMTVCLPSAERYRFIYRLQGAAKGHILFIIPYRAFYRSQASALFQVMPLKPGHREFVLETVDQTGIMLRTTGFSGHTMVVLTADKELERGIRNGRNLWQKWRQHLSYYPRFVRRVKDFQFRFHGPVSGGIRFQRTPGGIHANSHYSMDVRFRYHPEELRIDFNLYRIMVEMIGLFNHSFHPPDQAFVFQYGAVLAGFWVSPALDFSQPINAIAALASRFVKGLKDFNQEKPFHLLYRLEPSIPGTIQICGTAHPDVPIWGRFRIQLFIRRVTMDAHSGRLLRDELQTRITKGNRGSMTVMARLEALEP